MKWKRTDGAYHSDCGTYIIRKRRTHDTNGNIVNRYPWEVSKGKKVVCCYGLLSEAKAFTEQAAT